MTVHTFGTHTIKHRWAHGLVGFASGAGAGKAIELENGSFSDGEAENNFNVTMIWSLKF